MKRHIGLLSLLASQHTRISAVKSVREVANHLIMASLSHSQRNSGYYRSTA